MAEMATLGRPALSGGPLAGDKIVRMVFLDESGTGGIAKEPYFVLAGVIIHADKQWKAVENHLIALMNKYSPIPWGARPLNFCFHGTELYSGGKVFTRHAFPKEQRWEILDQLVAIPAKFDLPVVSAYVERSENPDTLTCYRGCYVEVAAIVEAYMRLQPDRNEVASIICEDFPEVRGWVKWVQDYQQRHVRESDLHADERDAMPSCPKTCGGTVLLHNPWLCANG